MQLFFPCKTLRVEVLSFSFENSAADVDAVKPRPCSFTRGGFNIRLCNDISVDTWIRMEQMTGALAWIRLPAVHLMIFLTGFQICLSAVLLTE